MGGSHLEPGRASPHLAPLPPPPPPPPLPRPSCRRYKAGGFRWPGRRALSKATTSVTRGWRLSLGSRRSGARGPATDHGCTEAADTAPAPVTAGDKPPARGTSLRGPQSSPGGQGRGRASARPHPVVHTPSPLQQSLLRIPSPLSCPQGEDVGVGSPLRSGPGEHTGGRGDTRRGGTAAHAGRDDERLSWPAPGSALPRGGPEGQCPPATSWGPFPRGLRVPHRRACSGGCSSTTPRGCRGRRGEAAGHGPGTVPAATAPWRSLRRHWWDGPGARPVALRLYRKATCRLGGGLE